MPLYRRVCAISNVAWLFVEGLHAVFYQFSFPRVVNSGMYGMEYPTIYFIGSGLLLVVLHSYVGGQVARYGIRLTTVVYQLGLIALSAWKYAISAGEAKLWNEFRAAVLYGSVTGAIAGFIQEIAEEL